MIEFLWNFIQIFGFFGFWKGDAARKNSYFGEKAWNIVQSTALGRIGNFTGGRWDFFYRVKGTQGWVILTIRTFFKTAFCEYWKSIKIKINMTCVSKGYEIKAMEQEQCVQLKMLFLLGYNLKIVV